MERSVHISEGRMSSFTCESPTNRPGFRTSNTDFSRLRSDDSDPRTVFGGRGRRGVGGLRFPTGAKRDSRRDKDTGIGTKGRRVWGSPVSGWSTGSPYISCLGRRGPPVVCGSESPDRQLSPLPPPTSLSGVVSSSWRGRGFGGGPTGDGTGPHVTRNPGLWYESVPTTAE